ncbi:MAG: site-specific integrase [Mariprofundaceae bacterium]|nr:site-specific integrase [Mariprofundaceae bacterium]
MIEELKDLLWDSPEAYGKSQELLMKYDSYSNWDILETDFLSLLDECDNALLEKAIRLRETQNYYLSSKPDAVQSVTTLKHDVKQFRLSVLLNKFIKESSVNWKDKAVARTQRSYIDAINLFIEVNHDCFASELMKEHVVKYKECLFKLPANRHKLERYRDLTIKQVCLLDIPNDEVISDTTKSNNINRVKSFLSWCSRNDYTCRGLDEPLQKLIKRNQRMDEERDVFSGDDLCSLFASPQYLNAKHKLPSHYWVPLLALFTGARQTELCQLHVSDIKLDESTNITYLDINDSDGKSLKTLSSKRTIPVHTKLIQLGFLDYVKHRSGERELFPECDSEQENISVSHKFQKWFNRTYLNARNCNIVGNKSFHSFRHTVANNLKQQGFAEHRVSELLGHQGHSTITYGRYGKGSSLLSKSELIEALDFNIDFEEIMKFKDKGKR